MSTSSFNPLGPAHFSASARQVEHEKHPAKRVAVFYATKEGHTKEIAELVTIDLRKAGFDVDLHDVRLAFPFDMKLYSAAVLAASVHGEKHEKEMIQFVKNHRAELERMPTAFLSVTLSEVGAEKKDATPAEHIQFVADVNKMLDRFFEETEWRPTYVKPVAGALSYSKYNFFIRFIMRRIARKQGAGTDVSRDYDYTNWIELDKFVEDLAARIRLAAGPPSPSGKGTNSQTRTVSRRG
jgi:menaquinone-dependent protoporphyrinogen oxidase